MITELAAAAAAQAPALSAGGIGLDLAAVGLLGGLAVAMHHKKKSPRIIGWICFIVGIPLADLFSGVIGDIAGISLWSIPVTMVLTGYVAFVFFHDGFRSRGGSRGGGFGGSSGAGGAHRWLQPIFGLLLPALLLTLGGSVGNGIHQGLADINQGAGNVVHSTTGR
jgi:hypothetical protein